MKEEKYFKTYQHQQTFENHNPAILLSNFTLYLNFPNPIFAISFHSTKQVGTARGGPSKYSKWKS